MNKKRCNTLLPLVQLLPAVAAAAAVLFALPRTMPVLAAVPEKLTAVVEQPVEAPSSEAVEEALPKLPYADGVYVGSSRGYGGAVRVQVTMENGSITEVEILDASHETKQFLRRAKRLLTTVVDAQSWEVDAVSEATYTSRGILGAVQNALTGEVVNNPLPPQPKPAAPLYAPEVLQKKSGSAGASRSESKDRPRREDRAPRAPRAERPERPAPQPKAPVELGEECHDEKSEQVRAFLKGLLEHMDSAAEVKVYESEKGRYKVYLEGEKLGALIGRRGETLDAIQQLTNYSINRGNEKNRVRVQVDAENYREKREQSLERLAEKVAGKVTKYRRNVTLEPMNAYERHVTHTALQDTPGVTTFSIGTEPNRRVVVSYDRTKE